MPPWLPHHPERGPIPRNRPLQPSWSCTCRRAAITDSVWMFLGWEENPEVNGKSSRAALAPFNADFDGALLVPVCIRVFTTSTMLDVSFEEQITQRCGYHAGEASSSCSVYHFPGNVIRSGPKPTLQTALQRSRPSLELFVESKLQSTEGKISKHGCAVARVQCGSWFGPNDLQ